MDNDEFWRNVNWTCSSWFNIFPQCVYCGRLEAIKEAAYLFCAGCWEYPEEISGED